MTMATVLMRDKGVITLPVEFRRRYGLDEGDVFTLLDLGDGAFLLTPRVSQVAHYGDLVAQMMEDHGVTLEEMLEALDEERKRYYQEHYVQN